MMPETSFQILNDETFPASLLLEFDELDDNDIPISPPRILIPVNNITISGSRSSVTTSQINSSNETYSLLTENENGSGSSNSSSQFVKNNSASKKRIGLARNTKTSVNKCTTSSSCANYQKRSQSEGNLLNTNGSQVVTGFPRSQKYGHVKSKVKQYIDETRSQHTHHPFVRHTSLPESTMDNVLQEKPRVEVEDANVLRAMLKETSDEVSNLQRHLEFTELLRKDDIAKIEALKRKIETMRLEHSKREKERQRERDSEKNLDRQLVLANYLRYSSQNSLNRVFASVSTQTSPHVSISFNNMTLRSDESFADILASNFTPNISTSTAPTAKRVLLYAPESQLEQDANSKTMLSPDSASHPEGSPDCPQNRPTATVSFQSSEGSTETTTELLNHNKSVLCDKCKKKKKKGKNKRTRLASFFCISKND